jgi:hypothetical protein
MGMTGWPDGRTLAILRGQSFGIRCGVLFVVACAPSAAHPARNIAAANPPNARVLFGTPGFLAVVSEAIVGLMGEFQHRIFEAALRSVHSLQPSEGAVPRFGSFPPIHILESEHPHEKIPFDVDHGLA